MESVDMVSAEQGQSSASQRVSKRLRKRPTYFMPGNSYEAAAEDDVKYRAVVTDHKGFKDFVDSVSFNGTASWRLSQILRRLSRGLKMDSRQKYVWAIWSEEKQSNSNVEWEKLTSLMQLKNLDVTKLRCYKQKKSPLPPKKSEPKETSRETGRAAPQQTQPAKQPQNNTPDMRSAMQMSSFPFFSQQEFAMAAYMMMLYSNPWFYMQPPFQ